jgi:hypothetical protein
MDHLAVLALWGDLAHRVVPVLNNGEKFGIIVDANSWILASVALGNFERGVFAAVVNDDVFPVWVGLMQHAFNAFSQILGSVVNGGDNAYEWRRINAHTVSIQACCGHV